MPQAFARNLMHWVFATKQREKWIDAQLERELYPYMITVMQNQESPVLAIGGTEDHIHLLTALSKNKSLVEVMKELKQSSSRFSKTKGTQYREFAWQIGYGAFSIGESGVPALIRYIQDQKNHHRKSSFQEEFLSILKKYKMPYDERYIWD